MRRKDDRILLRPGNKPPERKPFLNFNINRKDRSRRNARRRRNPVNPPHNSHYKNQSNPPSKTTVLLLILALVAFIIGAGVGVALSFDEGPAKEPHVENVTVEMTKNVTNKSNAVIYDESVDNVDYNNPSTLNNSQSNTGEYYSEDYSEEYSYDEGYDYSEEYYEY